MITKGGRRDNATCQVVHRFHKRQSCVFHSIHRLSTSFVIAGGMLSTSGNAKQNRRSLVRRADWRFPTEW